MAYTVSLKQFDGPLDLLLTLIGKARIDIQDIFVSEITEQYLEYMEGVDELDRRLMLDEYEEVCAHMFDIGLEDGFVQELEASDSKYIPIWDLTGV